MYDDLLSLPNVMGVGLGFRKTKGVITKEPVTVVFVSKKKPLAALAWKDVVPREYGIFRTDVVEVGHIVAQQDHLIDRKAKMRPARPGVSIGHYRITAGTFGAVVYDNGTNEPKILSNNHVLADSNAGQRGDVIVQPGPIDKATSLDYIGYLDRFVPIDFGEDQPDCPIASSFVRATNFAAKAVGSAHKVQALKVQDVTNQVDAAIAAPANKQDLDIKIIEIGYVRGVREPALGEDVQKSGRTTGYTMGRIIALGATIKVDYGGGKMAKFEDQIVADYMSDGGDSGSLVLDMERYAVGLLFAGSPQATIISPIMFVLDALQVRLL